MAWLRFIIALRHVAAGRRNSCALRRPWRSSSRLFGAPLMLAMCITGVGMTFSRTAVADVDAGGRQEDFVSALFLASAATPQGQGELQVALLANHFEPSGDREADFSLGLEYGLTDRLTLEVEAPYSLRNPSTKERSSSFGDIQVSGLYNFFRTESTLATVRLGINIPTGVQGGDLGTRSVEWEPSLLLAHRFSRFEVHAGLGARLRGIRPP